MILDPAAMKDLFLSVVRRAREKYAFSIDNFCVMGNHFHFIIKPKSGESLSSIMRWILSVFAMAYNKRMGLTGHVWGERFFSRIIESRRDFVDVFEYIDQNPVLVRLVRRPEDWKYGGLRHFLDGRRDILDEPRAWLGRLFPNRRNPSSI